MTEEELYNSIDDSKTYLGAAIKNKIKNTSFKKTMQLPKKLKRGDIITGYSGVKSRPLVIIKATKNYVIAIPLSSSLVNTDVKYLEDCNSRFTDGVFSNTYEVVPIDLAITKFIGVYDNPLKIIKNLKEIDSELNITSVESKRITTEKQMYEIAEEFILKGYEGAMLRHGDFGYAVNKRSDSLLKIKKFKDIQGKIIDIIPCDRRPSWGKPIISWNGVEFEAGTKMTHEQKEELLINKKEYIGKIAEIRYFEEYESGKPRFPVCYGIRLDC